MTQHRYHDLIQIFNRCFEHSHNTRLVKGGDEPIYLPASDQQSRHEIHFANGFFASALHECAHWLIAGEKRRQQVDFGYWYQPDGRNAEQQKLFESVEVKPQALEWILARCAAFPFRISADNLSGEETDLGPFKRAVWLQVERYIRRGLPARAQLLGNALCDFYQVSPHLQLELFDFESL